MTKKLRVDCGEHGKFVVDETGLEYTGLEINNQLKTLKELIDEGICKIES